MKSRNHNYSSDENLKAFVKEHSYHDKNNLLLQIFTGVCNEDYINTLIKTLTTLLPHVKIIGSSTDGEISNGKVYDNSTVISFSSFENSTIAVHGITYKEDSFTTGLQLVDAIDSSLQTNAKVLITFASGLVVNGEEFLDAIEQKKPSLIVSGGLAGDNAQFLKTFIFTQNGIVERGVVAAVIYSDILEVHTHYNFRWENIGKFLTVTSSDKNRVYSVDNIPTTELYKKYLGEEIEQMLPATGIEFPLIIKKYGINVARAVLAKHNDGSLSFAGNVEEGSKVQFGYGNIEAILGDSAKTLNALAQNPVESIFIYSCMARKRLLGAGIEAELAPLETLAPTAGFFTYGEFFYEKEGQNELLNQTMTLLTLSEKKEKKSLDVLVQSQQRNRNSHTISALSHLISVTSSELYNANKDLEGKVLEKTRELQAINENLKNRVKKKNERLEEQYEELVDVQKKLLENEKYASLGTLVAGVAHEINTPVGLSVTGITFIQNEIEKLQEKYKAETMSEDDFTSFLSTSSQMAHSINTNLSKAARLVKSFKQVAVDQFVEDDRAFNARLYMEEILLSLHNKTKLAKIDISLDIDANLIITSNPGALSQVITNFIMNSLLHAYEKGDKGEITIMCKSIKRNTESFFILEYCDDGKGLNEEVKSKIFDPFFTTKRGQGGSGLGMNIIYNIVTRTLKGKITVESELGAGTKFKIEYPYL